MSDDPLDWLEELLSMVEPYLNLFDDNDRRRISEISAEVADMRDGSDV